MEVRWVPPVMPTVDDPLPDLIRGLRNPTPDVRTRAARSLGRLGTLARDAMPLLVHALHDAEPAVREAAAQAMGQMGPDALPHLVAMLHHPDKYVRRNGVWALGKLGSVALGSLPALCESLRDADPRVASGAAQALGGLGERAVEAIPGLTEAMRGTNIVLCRLASKALSEIGRPALPTLLTHLRHRDPFVRGEAALALGWIGPAAAAAVPGLIESLQTTAPPPASDADPSATPAPPPAEEASRLYAAQSLGRIGPRAATALPALRKALTDPNEPLRQAAEQAIRMIETATE